MVRLGEGIGVDDIELLIATRSNAWIYLTIRLKSTGETLTIERCFSRDTANDLFGIQAIEFADGTVWEEEDILKQTLQMTENVEVTEADYRGSVIAGSSLNNTIYGKAGNDTFYGGGGNDTLYGNGRRGQRSS